jgi:hypothetical protein
MNKPSRNFVNLLADTVLAKVAEKPRFGKPFIRIGPLVEAVGAYVFRSGGCLGYSLQNDPALLGKLLGADPERAVNYVIKLEDMADATAEWLGLAEENNLENAYIHSEYARMGIITSAGFNESKLKDKCDADFAQLVTTLAMSKGASFGYFHPDLFEECFENTHGTEDESPRSIDIAISESAIGVNDWALNEAAGYLTQDERYTVNTLVEKSGFFTINE